MALYQNTITSDLNTNTSAAMESWIKNFVDYINSVTNIGASYRITAQTSSKTAFVLTLPVQGSHLTQFGIVMSTDPTVIDHMGYIVYNGSSYGYGTTGNVFDYSNYFAKKIMILKNDNSFYILAEKNETSFTTLVALDKVTELSSGVEYWGTRGFIPTSPTAVTILNLTADRSKGAATAGITNDISIANAFTEDGRFMMNNLYSFQAPAMTTLPKFMKFAVEDESGDLRYAVIMGETTYKYNNSTLGEGEFLMFID